MNEERARIDWQEVHDRLERARRALEAGDEPAPEEARRLLRERAQALARPREEVSTPTDVVELLVFALGAERYGIETRHVLEVVRLRGLTPVPCTPPFVLGVMSHRGRILAVLDLRTLLDLAGRGIAEGSQVVAVEAGGMAFGIVADAVGEGIRVAGDGLAPPPAALVGGGHAFIRGVTAGMVAVLDVEAMARDPRITVNEETG